MNVSLIPPAPGVARMEVNGEHVYTDGSGAYYPSATAVLAELWPYNGPPSDGRAARVGTRVHGVMAGLARGGEMEMEMIYAQEELAHCLRLRRHLEEVSDVYAVEMPMVGAETLGIGGTVDLVCRRDGLLTILDWKTKAREPDAEVVDRHHLQAAMYAVLWRELTGEMPRQTTVVASWPDGAQAYTREMAATADELFSKRVIDAVGRVRARLRPGVPG